MSEPNQNEQRDRGTSDSRRRFLELAGRFALATPPAVTLLLAGGAGHPVWASGYRGRQSVGGLGTGGWNAADVAGGLGPRGSGFGFQGNGIGVAANGRGQRGNPQQFANSDALLPWPGENGGNFFPGLGNDPNGR